MVVSLLRRSHSVSVPLRHCPTAPIRHQRLSTQSGCLCPNSALKGQGNILLPQRCAIAPHGGLRRGRAVPQPCATDYRLHDESFHCRQRQHSPKKVFFFEHVVPQNHGILAQKPFRGSRGKRVHDLLLFIHVRITPCFVHPVTFMNVNREYA